ALSAAGGLIAHAGATPAGTAEAIAVAALAGLVNARTWYGAAAIAARAHPRPHVSVPARVVFGLPFAPIAALLVLVLVVGVARLMFTGTIKVGGQPAADAPAATTAAAHSAAKAVLVVGGWGSKCCHDADGLSEVMPGTVVRQFSYAGLDAAGRPVPTGADADDLPLPQLGDRIAYELTVLHDEVRGPVDVVAESEGTLGVYAMLDRHRDLPVGSIVLLSPIVAPGQISYPPDTPGLPVPEYALTTLNHLVGGMSPYGPGGATRLLSSVGEFGARYFGHMTAASGRPFRWLAVIPLADALTLPVCGLPPDVAVVSALHGGLLGDPRVLPMVSSFLAGHSADSPGRAWGSGDMRTAAELITGAAAPWRMPELASACP
ncbi:MAG: hypothetical protein J2P26_08835, partial [Nocardiopsaceae bacterium]|nr:hypothetical protein [Nocardiopsaceae bacterium]